MRKRIKAEVTRFHLGRLHDAIQKLLMQNLDKDPEDVIGKIDVMRIEGHEGKRTYITLLDSSGKLYMTCVEEERKKDDCRRVEDDVRDDSGR